MKKLLITLISLLGLALQSQAVTNNLSWPARPSDEEVLFYNIFEWSNGGAGVATKVGTVPGTLTTFGLERTPGFHTYSVTASNALGEGPHGLTANTEPDVITAFTVARLSNRDVRFNWTTNVLFQKVTRHFIYEWVNNTPVLVGSTAINTLTVSGISAGQHEYTIVSSNNFGNSIHSLSILLKGPAALPGAPGNLIITSAGAGLQKLSILPPRGGVVVQRSAPGKNKFKTWTTVAAPANDTPTKVEITSRNTPAYDYRIKAR